MVLERVLIEFIKILLVYTLNYKAERWMLE